MKSFQERNQATIGVLSIVLLSLIALVTFYSEDLPIIGGGTTYTAHFREAAGLTASTEVRAAGVKVGTVTEVELEGDHVKVAFRVDDAWVGDRTTAEIGIKTLLGSKYLAIDPQGSARQDPDEPIPLERTTTPFDINEVFDQLSATVGDIDTDRLAKSMRVLTETFADSPPHVRSALEGLSALSETIASRDAELAKLLENTRKVSRTFADRKDSVRQLLSDGNLLLAELRARKESISELLSGTRELSAQLRGLVADNSARLRPALEQLDRVNAVLQRNQDELNRSLALAGPYYRLIGNTMGNGRWIDTYLCGLIEPPEGEPCAPPKEPFPQGGPR
ncbi:MCE family protein [Amycolatopsis cihanbeyliensis]|uniref:Phospholipid/cholesterol/gamma-HCH transport system substrate-binding protein n=1 Tax=Amycolatopsis cihanbeyliensis TaxID=1128664 RepID=A0A542DMB4_AMYCI|nr:MCE family protein [Amycolatopsis cihanbeyliensis]TQJ04236.1 phospholipid/cholesterol/gamma-HCH transport system substrate-binding protein [Amycolatopsis cihanbeyliensis]